MLAALTLAARLVLAGVFAVAGAAKLADRAGTRQAAVAFGAPAGSAPTLALALPLAELLIAGLLLPATTAVAGAAGAVVLLALFSCAIAVNMSLGRAPDCHCFGQLHSAPAGWKTLARNAALLGAAAFALAAGLAQDQRSAVAWAGRLEGSGLLAVTVSLAAAILLTIGAVGFVSLLRSYGDVLLRLERVEQRLAAAGLGAEDPDPPPELGLAPGSPAPFSGELEELLAPGLPLLLLFTSPSCGPCKALLQEAADWQLEHAERLTVAFASDGTAEDVHAEAEEFELRNVLVDADRRFYDTFEANGTPSAVLIAPDGTIGSWVAPGRDWIEALVARALEQPENDPGLPVGTEAPALELPALNDQPVALADFQGRETLLLFWNPECGYCRAMHQDVVAWEHSANGAGPRLVVISSGDAESTRAEGFASTVLIDEEFTAGGAFGAGGTPMAVLVGADGRVASRVVAGAEGVLALARNGSV